MRRFRWLAAIGATAAATVGTIGMAMPAQAASSTHYVALGDSYSSGVGAGDYIASSGDCDRSPNAYSALWAAANSPASYTSVACGGATTSSVSSTQLSALSTSTNLVSITVGGNDVGFSSVFKTCVLDSTSSCVSAVQAGEKTAENTLPAELDSTFSGIASHAPNAKVVVLDYPDFYDTSNSFCIGLSGTDRTTINQGIDILDGVIQSAAARHGFTFADVRSAFSSHEICSGDDWLHSLNITDIDESYHPTADGQSGGYLPVFTSAAS